jgi:uncharacterized membrane protein YkoI
MLSLLLGSPFSATAGDRIDIKELPKVVLTGIQMRFPDAEILSAERDKDDGGIEYEVKIRHKGQRYEVELTEDGRITDIDREDD